jgi:hypothetical protein
MVQTMLITVANHGRSNHEHVLILLATSGLSTSAAVHEKSMATEIPEGWASWKAPGYLVMARIQSIPYTIK